MGRPLRGWVTACLITALSASAAEALRQLGPGDPVPAVAVVDAGGDPVPLSRLLGERGALVVFWAAWNPRSSKLLAFLAQQRVRYEKHGLRVVPVNTEHEGVEPGEIGALAQQYAGWALPWPSYFDPGLDAYAAFGVMTHPTTVYLDGGGRIVGVYPGFPAEGLDALPELIARGLGIPPSDVHARRPVWVAYQPKDGAGALLQTGRLLLARGQSRKALEKVESALARDPDYAIAYAAGAFLASRRGQDADSGRFLAPLRERAESGTAFREAFGAALLALGRDAEAAATLSPLVDEEEPHPLGLVALAQLRADAGDREGAEALVHRLRDWPMGGVHLEIDLSPYMDPEAPPETWWTDREQLARRLLGLGDGGAP